MSRTTRLLTTTAALALSTTMATAEVSDASILAAYEGYQSIEITRTATRIKVEAVRDGVKVETIYDAVTGAILASETKSGRRRRGRRRGLRRR